MPQGRFTFADIDAPARGRFSADEIDPPKLGPPAPPEPATPSLGHATGIHRAGHPPDQDELRFQEWYKPRALALGLDPDPDNPLHFYDYRAAFAAGAEPDPVDGHWPSTFKREGHPQQFVGGLDTRTGVRPGVPQSGMRQDDIDLDAPPKLGPPAPPVGMGGVNARIGPPSVLTRPPISGRGTGYEGNVPLKPGAPRTFMSSLAGGAAQTSGMFSAFGEATGELVGSKGLAAYGAEGRRALQTEEQAAEKANPAQTFQGIDSIGKFGQWLKETVGNQIPIMAPPMAGAAAGGAVGAVAGPPGMVIGAAIGAFVPSFVLGVGEVQGNIKSRGEQYSAPAAAFIGGSAVAALDSVLPAKVGSFLVKKFGLEIAERVATSALMRPLKGGMIARVADGATVMATNSVIEGITEGAQEVIGELATAKGTGTPIDPNLPSRVVEVSAAGALMGFLSGAAEAVPRARPDMPSATDALGEMAAMRAEAGLPSAIPPAEPQPEGPQPPGFRATRRGDPPIGPADVAPPPVVPPAPPGGETIPGTIPGASVPFMITKAMEAELTARGYTPEAINAMKPEDAHAILARTDVPLVDPAVAPPTTTPVPDPPIVDPPWPTPPVAPPGVTPPGQGPQPLPGPSSSEPTTTDTIPVKKTPAERAAAIEKKLAEEAAAAAKAPPPTSEALEKFLGKSVVREPDGSPRVGYHATTGNFEEFIPGGPGKQMSGPAIWVGFNKGEYQAAHNVGGYEGNFKPGTSVMPLYVRLENPLVITKENQQEVRQQHQLSGYFPKAVTVEEVARLQTAGYDGIVDRVYSITGAGEEVAVFSSSQLKSAIGNTGLFDATSGNIVDRPKGTPPIKRTAAERAAAIEKKLADEAAAKSATGQHYYRPLLRPAGFASLPTGLKWDYAEVPHTLTTARPDLPVSDHPHGVIVTDRALTFEELEKFDLAPLGGPPKAVVAAPRPKGAPPIKPKTETKTEAKPGRPFRDLDDIALDKKAVEGDENDRAEAKREREARRRDVATGTVKPEAKPEAKPPEAKPVITDEKRAALQKKLEEAKQKFRDELRAQGSTLGANPIPTSLIVRAIEVIEVYAEMGLLEAQEAYQSFKADFADVWVPGMKRVFELAWDDVHNVSETSVTEEPDATTDDQESDDADGGRLPGREDAPARGDGASGEGALGDVPTGTGEGVERPGAGRPSDGDQTDVLADGVPDRPDADSESGDGPRDGGGTVPGGSVSPSGAKGDPGGKPSSYTLTADRIKAVIGRGAMERARGNITAIRIAKQLLAEKRHATADEQAQLAMWVGWGATDLADYLREEPRSGWRGTQTEIWQELKDLLTDAELRGLRTSSTNAHFTYDLYQPIWNAIVAAGFGGGRVLEPAVGAGHAFGFMPPQVRANSILNGVELEPITAQIAQALYPEARIQPVGYEASRIARNTQDLVISNVPFADSGVTDGSLKAFLTDRIHNYFFAKALEHVRPGGFVVFVTSRYTMDGQPAAKVRRYLMEKAHFVGAIRLPNTSFDKSAGTEVVTDIVILQRLMPGETARNSKAFVEAPRSEKWSTPARKVKQGRKTIEIPPKSVYRSAWYDEHPEYVLGTEDMSGSMRGANEYAVTGKREGLNDQIEQALRAIMPPGSYTARAEALPDQNAYAEGKFKVGELRVGSDGMIQQVDQNGELVDATPKRGTVVDLKAVERITSMINVRDSLREVIQVMQQKASTNAEVQSAQASLQNAYDNFKRAFGNLNALNNRRLFSADPEANNLLGLETTKATASEVTDKNGRKTIRLVHEVTGLAEIFTKRTLNAPVEIVKVETPKEALLASLGVQGGINWPYMGRVFLGPHVPTEPRPLTRTVAAGHRVRVLVGPSAPYDGTVVRMVPKNPNDPTDSDSYLVQPDAINENRRKLGVKDGDLAVAKRQSDLADLGEAVSGVVSPEIITELQDKLKAEGLIYEVPDGSWQVTEEYLSGDVVTKLVDAEAALAEQGERFAPNVAALKAIQPIPKLPDEIKFSLGAHWIPVEDLQQFVADRFNTTITSIGDLSTIAAETIVRWNVRPEANVERSGRLDSLAVPYGPVNAEGKKPHVYGFFELLDDALNLNPSDLGTMEGTGKDKHYVRDQEATDAARANVDDLRDQWMGWIAENEEVEKRLTEIFNVRFNRTVKRTYDGGHLVNITDYKKPTQARTAALPGLALMFPLYKHQLNAVWRILTGGNTLLAHEVGAGKTFEMIVAAMEMRRTGRARKPLITVPTYLLSQWRADIMKAYPQARVLAFESKDLGADKRQQAMARIAYGDWDIVLVPHSSFELLSVSPERSIAVLHNWVDELMDAERNAINDSGGRHPSVKQLAGQRKRLEEKIKKKQDKAAEGADQGMHWDQLGVDALFVDEAHAFKNLFFFSQIRNMRGLSRSEADRSLDLYLKIQDINEQSNYRNLVLATATPIMNSVAEVFTMQRYLQPQRLRELGMQSFDHWYATHAEVNPVVESLPDNTYKEVMRLNKFRNLKFLSSVFSEVMDLVRWEDMPYLELPKLKGGKPTVVEGEPHPLMERLREWFSERLAAIEINPPKYNAFTNTYTAPDRKHFLTGASLGRFDNILTVMRDAQLAAIDPRLILGVGNEAADFTGSRVQVAAKLIAGIHKRETARKGAVLVFLDSGTPKVKNSLEFLGDAEIEDDTDGASTGTEDQDIADDDMLPEDDGSDFNMYEALKATLVKRGIPSHEIAFIHDAEKPAERVALFEAVNSGKVRVLIASTDKGGVGMNVQERLAALVHMDVPRYPRPGDIKQRQGRIIRQGNTYFFVESGIEEIRFVTKGSADEWSYGLIAGKQRQIEDFMTGEVDDIEEDDPSTMSLEEAKAVSTRDDRVVELIKLRGSLKRLNAQANAAERNYGRARTERAEAIGNLAELKQTQERFGIYSRERRRGALKAVTGEERTRKRGKPPMKQDFAITIGKTVYTKRTEANAALLAAMEQVLETYNRQGAIIGEFQGLPLRAVMGWGETVHLSLKPEEAGVSAVSIATIDPPKNQEAFGAGRNVVQSLSERYGRMLEFGAELPARIEEAEARIVRADAVLEKGPPEAIERARNAREKVGVLEKTLKDEGDKKRKEQREKQTTPPPATPPPSTTPAMPSSPGMALPGQPQGGAPLTPKKGGPPVKPREGLRVSAIIKALTVAIGGTPVRSGRMGGRRALGFFRFDTKGPRNNRSIRLKHANDLRVAIHEFGHDFDISLLKIDRQDQRWENELLQLGKNTSKPSYTHAMITREGAAEFFVLYMSDPTTAEQLAPNYYAEVHRVLNLPQFHALRDGLYAIRDTLDEYRGLTPEQRGRLAINRDTASNLSKQIDNAVSAPRDAIRDIAVRTVDDLAWLRHAVEDMMATAGDTIDAAKHAYFLARIARGAGAIAEQFMEKGVYGLNGERLGPSLKEAISSVRNRLALWEDYMVALRIVELIEDRGRVRPGLTLEEAKAIIAATEARKDFKDFEKARDTYWEYKDAILEYARERGAFSQEQIDDMKALNRAYIPLKRIMDVAEDAMTGGGRKLADRSNPLKRIGDSNREIIPPLESVAADTYAIVSFVESNQAMIALTEQAGKAFGAGKWLTKEPTPKMATTFNLSRLKKEIERAIRPITSQLTDPQKLAAHKGMAQMLDRMVTVFTPAMFNPAKNEQFITVIRNGQREFWQVNHQGLYDAITMMGPKDTAGAIATLAQGATNVLRTTATTTFSFIERNLQRDTIVALLQSRYGFIPIWDQAKFVIDAVRGHEDLKRFWTSGVVQATMVGSTRQGRSDYVKRLAGERDKRILSQPKELVRAIYSALQWLSQNAEMATRYGEFKIALGQNGVERTLLQRLTGQSETRDHFLSENTMVKATMAARDVTTDFQRGGSLVKEYSRYKAFVNANVQGYVRMGETLSRSLRDMPLVQQRNGVWQASPNLTGAGADLLLKLGALSLLSQALWFMNRDDDEWKEKAEWEKGSYWFIKFPGTDYFIKIAKPFEWGQVANVTEAALSFAYDGDKDRFKDMADAYYPGWDDKDALLRTVLNLSPTILVPALEAFINYDAFRDAPVWNPYERGGRAKQYTTWTSETAKVLQEVMPILNPAQIDHMITGYTSNFGKFVLSGSDAAMAAVTGKEGRNAPTKPISQNPFVGALIDDGSFSGQSDSIQDLYKLAEAIQAAEADRDDGAPTGGPLKTTRGTLSPSKTFNVKAAKGLFSEAQKRIRRIYEAPLSEMTPDQKNKALQVERKEMIAIARRALAQQ